MWIWILFCNMITVVNGASGFIRINSQFCSNAGATQITSSSDCEKGADALGLSHPSGIYDVAGWGGFNTRPPRCIFEPDTTSNTKLCFSDKSVSVACSTKYNCICKLEAPTCEHTTGQTANAASCTCGSIACLVTTKSKYCMATDNWCSTILCRKGTYATYPTVGAPRVCKECLAGQYNDKRDMEACKTCPSGKEPTGDHIACVVIGEQASIYFEKTSGSCTEVAGGSAIETKEECKIGASYFGWDQDKGSIQEADSSRFPNGCIQGDYNLKFNTYTGSESSGRCRTYNKCICKFKCQPGTYQDQTGQTSCKECPVGRSNIAGRSNCAVTHSTITEGNCVNDLTETECEALVNNEKGFNQLTFLTFTKITSYAGLPTGCYDNGNRDVVFNTASSNTGVCSISNPCYCKKSCFATQVANSDKAATDSITGTLKN